MKLLFASDIHGSAYWCDKVLEAFEEHQADRLVLLGDLLYHGPRNSLPGGHNPHAVADLLNLYADKIIAVRGNCDAEVDQMMLDFPCMADYALIVTPENTTIFATHGHIYSPHNHPKLGEHAYFVSGHTHIKVLEERDGIQYVNPGSAALPKDGSHSYALYDAGVCSLHCFKDEA